VGFKEGSSLIRPPQKLPTISYERTTLRQRVKGPELKCLPWKSEVSCKYQSPKGREGRCLSKGYSSSSYEGEIQEEFGVC